VHYALTGAEDETGGNIETMKNLIFITLLLVSFSSKHQTSIKSDEEKALKINNKHNDTIFISREVTKNNYCATYIEKNRQSDSYKDLLRFQMDSNEIVEYKQNYGAIKKYNPAPYKVYDLFDFPKEWVPLYKYKNNYYVYPGSESGAEGRITVTDSTLNYWYMDGVYPEPFQSVQKLNKYTWSFKIPSQYDNTTPKTIIIHIIDFKNMTSVWEDSSEKGHNRYGLYIPKKYAMNFDMIVNFCSEIKAAPFIFDEPDYEALLKSH
jgi:hypothetical protein